ncbi:hypothetical protein BDD30_2449 [Photorhabdus asymbiotica]|uniref:Toxin SymE-like domain-containing protein n=1 Tax=Photorhabdus asymbiotica TaxID=291112 RepID=A0ABX9SJE8_9GAMM|nr:type I toxin-antitoxin system SymE family toxin [Photorhabdus asymbiotica]RKS57642.1 hypothetical protein BDD30_2449 [Photorhabdus asymbiotica]
MAKAHSKAEAAINKAVKTETLLHGGVCANGNKVNNVTPAIHLKGQWLNRRGLIPAARLR